MNRAQKRMMDRRLKKKLTPEQFKELNNQAFELRVREEVDRFAGNFISVFLPAMRENKISEERANRIVEDVIGKAHEKFDKGDEGEPRPELIEADTIEKVIAAFLESQGVKDSEELAKGLYSELMKAAKEETQS